MNNRSLTPTPSPRTPKPETRRSSSSRRTPAVGSSGALVLVVDDFVDAREMYAEYLEFESFRTAQAGNGKEALEKALALKPDIILMDLSLPGIDGWEATRRLKGDPRTRHIPVVALTGHALAAHAQGAKDAGCDSFVAKPCVPDKLVAEIRMVLARRS